MCSLSTSSRSPGQRLQRTLLSLVSAVLLIYVVPQFQNLFADL